MISPTADNLSILENDSLLIDSFANYDYGDFADDENYFNLEWFIKFLPSVLVYSLTFIFGFFGNLLVIFSICYLKKLRSITNMFLMSLATADLLLIVVCVPIKVINIIIIS